MSLKGGAFGQAFGWAFGGAFGEIAVRGGGAPESYLEALGVRRAEIERRRRVNPRLVALLAHAAIALDEETP